jgi:hypothetical protein
VRRPPVAIQPPPILHIDLAERLRVTAKHLQTMPPELATSLSITTSWQDRTEADVRALARAVAGPLGFMAVIEGRGDSVTVIFRRPDRRHR